MINIAIVGIGYWGPNLARDLAISSDGRLHTICDARPERLAKLVKQYPGAKLEAAHDKVLSDPEVVNFSILLFALTGEGASPGHITGKLFEYLGARSRILGIVSPDFEAARIIQETGAGVAVNPDDEEGIESVLLDSYARFKAGTDQLSRDGDLSLYERKHTAKQLAELMTELTEARNLVAASPGRMRKGELS